MLKKKDCYDKINKNARMTSAFLSGGSIMGKPQVLIVGFTTTGEKVCAAGGRVSTQPGTALDIWAKSQDEEKNENLIFKVTQSGHDSTVEHCFFNLVFDEVSVVTEQFMIEFRLASFTIKSRRYVDFGNVGYIIPEFDKVEQKEEYISTMDSLFDFYNKMVENGVPKEDARFVLPYCFKSNFFCSMNGRELIRVLEAMIYGRGKDNPEIYGLGVSLLEQARKLAPGVMKNFEERHCKYSDSFELPFQAKRNNTEKPLCELLASTADAELTVAKSALLQYDEFSKEEIEEILSDEKNISDIISSVIKSNRPRALECANFTFRLNNVSLACLTHFSRHRMQSINIPPISVSDRASYVLPDSVKEKGLEKEYIECFKKTETLYKKLKADGVNENILSYVLLAGNTVDFTLTMNARELLLFTKLRSCTRAQWEIQNYAVDMLMKLRKAAPLMFNFYGPSCFVTGFCPEGRLSCGRVSEMKEKFKN